MEKLWSPWRSKYIESFKTDETKNECMFCVAGEKDVDDLENLVVRKSKLTFTLLNLYPYNNGHLMVVPYRHIGELSKLLDEETSDLMNELKTAQHALNETLKPQGFNIGANLGRSSGAGIADHLHFHIVPRWNGDTNFMPVLGEVKIISQDLKETKVKLIEAYKS
jgi:ATP adenylyltransferase